MSDNAKQRIQAIGKQLDPGPRRQPEQQQPQLPPIQKVAGRSSGPRVQGKVIIITGTNSPLGIGRATAHQLAENGARALYLCDYDGTHLDAHKAEIAAAFPAVDVHVRRFDAADEAAVKDVVDHALRTYGRLDVFFANAGITGPLKLFTQVTEAEFTQNFRTNVLRWERSLSPFLPSSLLPFSS